VLLNYSSASLVTLIFNYCHVQDPTVSVFIRDIKWKNNKAKHGFQLHALTDFTWTTSFLNTNAIEITGSACNDYIHLRLDGLPA
jgi:hypothetical protein